MNNAFNIYKEIGEAQAEKTNLSTNERKKQFRGKARQGMTAMIIPSRDPVQGDSIERHVFAPGSKQGLRCT